MKDEKRIITQKQIIRTIVSPYQKNKVTASQFFISWNGVPVLAYTGFSPILLAIKNEITSKLPDLPGENPGSRWPKTTLGALRDNKTLSIEELNLLRTICDSLNTELQDLVINIDKLAVVIFYCRSLEKRLLTETIHLVDPRNTLKPPKYHLDHVSGVLKDFSRNKLKEYLSDIQKKGHRESHYRSPSLGATLIFELEKFPDIIEQFRHKVDEKLPFVFRWFNNDSLHITVKTIA